jgi:glycosyltransferase involved in cell wall biosynthesis
MNLIVVLDHRFYATPEPALWTKTAYGDGFWQRYLRGFERVTIVARAQSADRPRQGWQRVDNDRVNFAPVPYYLGPWQYLRRLAPIRKAVREALSGESAVILRSGELANCAAGVLWKEGRPFGLEVGGDPYDSLAPGCVRSAVRPLARIRATRALKQLCSSAFAVSYVTQHYLQQRYPAQGMQFAISDVDLPPEEERDGNSPLAVERRSRPVRHVLFVGSLAQMYKGVDVLLAAVAACVADFRLSILGDGRHRQELERLANTLGLAGRVRFLGEVPAGRPIRDCLDTADLFVLPSRTEGLPRAMLEAMARALPCIGTAAGGVPELLDPEDLVPAGDAAALADMIERVCGDPVRRVRMAARNLRKAGEYRGDVLTRQRDEFYRHVRNETERWLAVRQQGRFVAVGA